MLYNQIKEALYKVLSDKLKDSYPAEELRLLIVKYDELEQVRAHYYHHTVRARIARIKGLTDVYLLTPCKEDQERIINLINSEADRLLIETKQVEEPYHDEFSP